MIVIKIISGPHAGKVRVVSDGLYEGKEINPLQLLMQLVQLGSNWEIDFSQATPAEVLDWGRADMVNRIVRALLQKRFVEFQDVKYRVQSVEDIQHVAGEVEDAIAQSGYHVMVASDDEHGMLIETGERE